MKMKLTLVLLLFLGVGVLARTPSQIRPEAELAVNEWSERFARSASGESPKMPPGQPNGEPSGGNSKAASNEAGMKNTGMSGENKSENSSGKKNKGGKSKESGNGGQSNGGGSDCGSEIDALVQQLTSKIGIGAINDITDVAMKYYTGSLSVPIEALLKTLDFSTTLREMTNKSMLYQLMKNIPIVGTIVQFMRNTMSIPINAIAFALSLITTIVQHVFNSIPNIL
ncbi:uncharacterized protein LOC143373338 isoform X2 [Andrena cerasifolii]|uniref:uncharacterized protein LOC143373338 isoform X2 n=1 Tax=Andrena cerasifolii TaxID=2819439 RepID=UPI004037A910